MLTAGYAGLALSALIFALYAYLVATRHGGQSDPGTAGDGSRFASLRRAAFVALGIILSLLTLAALLLLLRNAARGELDGWEGAVLLGALVTLALALMTVSWVKESPQVRVDPGGLPSPQPRPLSSAAPAAPGAMADDRPMPSRRLGWLGREATAHESSEAANPTEALPFGLSLGAPAIPTEPQPSAMPLMTARRVFAATRMGAEEADEPAMAVLARGPLRSSILPILPEDVVPPTAPPTAAPDPFDIPPPPASAVDIATLPAMADPARPSETPRPPEERVAEERLPKVIWPEAVNPAEAVVPGRILPQAPAEPPPLPSSDPGVPFAAPAARTEAPASDAPTPPRAPLATDFDWLPQPAQRPVVASAPERLTTFNIASPAIQTAGFVAQPRVAAAPPPEAPIPQALAPQTPPAESWSPERREVASKLELIGGIDMVMPRYQLFGWAADASGTAAAEAIEIVALRRGVEIGRARPQELREDLRHINQGNCGFTMQVTTPLRFAELADGTVEVRAQVGGQIRVLPPSDLLRTVSGVASAVAGMSEAIGGLDPGDVAEILQGLVRTREIDERIASRCIDLHSALLAQAGRQLERRP